MKKIVFVSTLMLSLVLLHSSKADIPKVEPIITSPDKPAKKEQAQQPQQKKPKPVEQKKPVPPPAPKPKKYRLSIKTIPAGARVKNLDIGPAHKNGMKLEAKRSYRIQVSKSGYKSVTQRIKISNADVSKTIRLEKKPPPPKKTVAPAKKSTTTSTPSYGKASRPKMIPINGGTYQIGCMSGKDCQSNENVHSVTIGNFSIGQTEVTVGQYMACVKAGACRNPEWKEKGSNYNIYTGSDDYYKKLGKALTGNNYPIVGVSWHDANDYAKWLGSGYRLPTEAEWEVAARAGKHTAYPWGNNIGRNKANCYEGYCGDNYKYTAPVSSFRVYGGLYNMHGNAWEWVASAYPNGNNGRYDGSETKKASANDSRSRVLRGGSWSNDPWTLRSAYRFRLTATSRDFIVGFRVARTR